MEDSTKLFDELKPTIDLLITERLIAFYNMLLERGQITTFHVQEGITADYKADSEQVANQTQ